MNINSNVVLVNNQTDSASIKWDMQFIGLDVPLILQEDDDYCGPASTLQIITYWNKLSYVPGSGEYQDRIACYVMEGGDSYVWRIRKHINDYYTPPYTYQYYCINSSSEGNSVFINSESLLIDYINRSLNNNCPVISGAVTNSLSYYYGKTQYHFLCVAGYDPDVGEFLIRDCNNTIDVNDLDEDGDHSEKLFFGEFSVTVSELYNASIGSGKYIICKGL